MSPSLLVMSTLVALRKKLRRFMCLLRLFSNVGDEQFDR